MISDESVKSYILNIIKNGYKGYNRYKIKDVKFISIEHIEGFQFIVVEYKVAFYRSNYGFIAANSNFTPNNFQWIEEIISLDLADPETKRELLLNDVLDL